MMYKGFGEGRCAAVEGWKYKLIYQNNKPIKAVFVVALLSFFEVRKNCIHQD